MASGTLEVILLQGKDLKDVEKLGKQSPYCLFVCGDIRTRSQTCKDGGKNPVWKEAFAFEITNQVELGILVMSEHRNSKDATIGASHIPLTEVEGKGWVDVTTPVTVNKSGKSQGVLMLQMRYRMHYADQVSEVGDSGGRNLISPYRQSLHSARYGAISPPPQSASLARGLATEFRDLPSSVGNALHRRGVSRQEIAQSPDVLMVQHNSHLDTMSELPSASSSNSNINLDDTAHSPAGMPTDLDARLADIKMAEHRYEPGLLRGQSKFGDHRYESTLMRGESRLGEHRFEPALSRGESRRGENRFEPGLTRAESRLGDNRFEPGLTRAESRLGDNRFEPALTRGESRLGENRFEPALSRGESKLGELLRSGEPRLSESLSKPGLSRLLDRSVSQLQPPSTPSVSSSMEFDSLRKQLTEMTQKKAALEASLAETEEEAAALRNKISTISSMSFKDRKSWIEEKEHLQLELLTLKQQLGEQTDSALIKQQQHEELRTLRSRLTELEAEVNQHKSSLQQQKRMSAEQLMREQTSVQEALQQVEELNRRVTELYETHSQLVGGLETHLDNTTAELASSVAGLQQDKAELQQLIQRLQGAHREALARAAESAGVDSEEMERAISELKQAHSAELKALRSELAAAEVAAARTAHTLRAENQELEQEKMQLIQEKAELLHEKAELSQEKADLMLDKAALEEMAEEVSKLKRTHVFLPQEEHIDLLAFKSRCSYLQQTTETKINDLASRLQQSEQQLASTTTERNALLADTKVLQAEREALSTKLFASESECQELREVGMKREAVVVELEHRLEESRGRIVELEARVEELQGVIAGLEGNLSEEVVGRASDADVFGKKLEALERERWELEVQTAELQEQLATAREQLQEAKEQAAAGMASMQEQLTASALKVEEHAREIETQREQLTSERERAEQAEVAMQAAQQEAEEAAVQVTRAKEETAEVQVKVMVLDSDIKTLRESLDAAHAGRKDVEEKFQEMKQKYADQKEQLQEQIEEQRAEILSMARERDAAIKSLKSLQEHVQAQTGKGDEVLMKELLEKNFEMEMLSEDLKHENDVLTQDLVATKLELARLREVETLFRREVFKAKHGAPNGRTMAV